MNTTFAPHTAKFDNDRITVVLDDGAEDWHVDAEQGYDSSVMGALIERIYGMGYEAMSEDECEAEILDSGAVRVYYVPVGA